MKTIIRMGILSFIGIMFLSDLVSGQETTSTVKNPTTGKIEFTQAQKAMIKAKRAKQIEFKNAFRKTLSSEQLNILSDPRLMRYDRVKSLRASFTDDQVALIKEHRKQMATQKQLFRSTLTDSQRKRIKMMALNKMQLKRHLRMEAL